MSNAIVEALDKAVERVGKALGKDAGKAVEDLYRDADGKVKDVVKRTLEADSDKAEEMKKILGDMDENAAKTVTTDAEREEQAAAQEALRKRMSDVLDPAGGSGGISKINGRMPINSKYAGKLYDGDKWTADLKAKYPNGVRFTKGGFPDFKPYAKATVKLSGLTGDYATDERAALQKLGLSSTPNGMVWHHVEDGQTMHLIPQDVHRAVRHTGGAAIIKSTRP